MKGRPPFQGEEGGPPPPSSDPIALLNFALAKHPGKVTMVNFAGSVKEVRILRAVPPSGSCYHVPSGEEDIVDVCGCWCGATHSCAERCLKCQAWVPYHDFPGRERVFALLAVEAPVGVGKNLQGPPAEQDAYLLIHIDRSVMDEFDSPIAQPLIVLPGGL